MDARLMPSLLTAASPTATVSFVVDVGPDGCVVLRSGDAEERDV
ncbi:hypothetical protein [Curtobacterium aetherium]|nr:hypothetical protein [Curtobacterium sp. L6-1]